MEFSSAVCEIDAYSWNINFKNSNNITVATMGRNCNDEWYDTGMTELSGLLSNPLHQLLAIATQAQGSVLVGQSGSVLIPSQQ
ncbi:MAG: hypothetical protein DYG96_03425 [Chlorobi bacterium CHB2]|nr:hypothetical protein [Chlorobi bacterium CHB2]